MASFNSRRRPQTKAMAQQLKELDEEYEEEHQGYRHMESMNTFDIQADVYAEVSSDEEDIESLENPDIYFGEKAKDKFWDFYKSERRFKDFNK